MIFFQGFVHKLLLSLKLNLAFELLLPFLLELSSFFNLNEPSLVKLIPSLKVVLFLLDQLHQLFILKLNIDLFFSDHNQLLVHHLIFILVYLSLFLAILVVLLLIVKVLFVSLKHIFLDSKHSFLFLLSELVELSVSLLDQLLDILLLRLQFSSCSFELKISLVSKSLIFDSVLILLDLPYFLLFTQFPFQLPHLFEMRLQFIIGDSFSFFHSLVSLFSSDFIIVSKL
jgi:hypothetical protein